MWNKTSYWSGFIIMHQQLSVLTIHQFLEFISFAIPKWWIRDILKNYSFSFLFCLLFPPFGKGFSFFFITYDFLVKYQKTVLSDQHTPVSLVGPTLIFSQMDRHIKLPQLEPDFLWLLTVSCWGWHPFPRCHLVEWHSGPATTRHLRHWWHGGYPRTWSWVLGWGGHCPLTSHSQRVPYSVQDIRLGIANVRDSYFFHCHTSLWGLF